MVFVNDFSTDGSLKYIENLKKQDPRIKIINNKKNMGILYSRSIGALLSKGKYIFPVDNDDIFFDKDVFSTVSNIAEKGDFDIVEFRGIEVKQIGRGISNRIIDINWTNKQNNMLLTQPDLGNYPIRAGKNLGTYDLFDVYLWNKCIKTEVYQKALTKLGKEKYSRFMLAHEDVLAVFFLFNTAKTYKFIGKYGICHIKVQGSAYFKTGNLNFELKEFYLLDIVMIFSQNSNEHRKLIPNLLIIVLGLKLLPTIVSNESNHKLLISMIDKILKSDLYNESFKNEIRKRGKNLKFLKYDF